MKKTITAIVICLAGIIGIGNCANAQEAQTSYLTFSYNGDTGVLDGRLALDRRAKGFCTLRIRGGVGYPGDEESRLVRTLYKNQFRKPRIVRFTIGDLSGVVKDDANQNPILTLQARLECSRAADADLSGISNATARFVNCGPTRKNVALRTFLLAVESGLAEEGSVTAK